MFVNPTTESKSNRDGTTYIISRMQWYCTLSSPLLKTNTDDIFSLAGMRAELEKRVINLYQELLLYLVKSVCSCYRKLGVRFLRDMFKLDDWDGNLKTVKDAEIAFLQDSNIYNALGANSRLESLVNSSKNQERELLHDKKDKKCFQDLHLTDPRDDKTRIEHQKGGLLQDSYRWIFHNADFREWREDRQSRLLWIKGDPGKGKTMLLCGIIDELKKSTAHNCLLSFFFCEYDQPSSSVTAVLRGLIFLLIDQQPSLISHVRKKYDHAGKDLFDDVNAWVALSEIFTNILQDPSLKIDYLIIDALDECKPTDLPKLLDLIIQRSSVSSRVKWIVSSRNWSEIEVRLETAGQKVQICLELNAETVSIAVRNYIKYQVDHLAQLSKYDDTTSNTVRDFLSSNANATFLWVALVCQNVENCSKWDVLEELKNYPPSLDKVYQRMMDKICTSASSNRSKHILALVTVVRRPIMLNELTTFIEGPKRTTDDLKSMIGLCGSFLTLRKDTVYFVHQSAKDFLEKKKFDEIFPSGIAELHHTIFSKSLKAMSLTLRRDMYSLCTPGFPIERVQQPDPDPLAAVRYSCVYWVEHLLEWDRSITAKERNNIDEFLRQKFLYWLEALSLLGGMSEGVLSIVRLDGFLQVRSKLVMLSYSFKDVLIFL